VLTYSARCCAMQRHLLRYRTASVAQAGADIKTG